MIRTACVDVAVDALRRGAVVAFPTDTLYGLAVDPRDAAAVERLFTLKGRPAGMAVPLVAADAAQAELAGIFGSAERRLAAAFWPGALSIVVPARATLAAAVLGGGSTVAVRVPDHALARALAGGLGACVTATSANRSGRPPARSADDVDAALGAAVDVLLEGEAPGGPPSTIVRVEEGVPVCVRAGAVAWERVLRSLE